eukprot:765252-Hanusia_phi.AAC.3
MSPYVHRHLVGISTRATKMHQRESASRLSDFGDSIAGAIVNVGARFCCVSCDGPDLSDLSLLSLSGQFVLPPLSCSPCAGVPNVPGQREGGCGQNEEEGAEEGWEWEGEQERQMRRRLEECLRCVSPCGLGAL